MSTKIGTLEQHQLLHLHYPGDCCLCRLENNIKLKEAKTLDIDKTCDKLKEELFKLLDEFFPRNQNKQRGEALAMGLLLIIKLKEMNDGNFTPS